MEDIDQIIQETEASTNSEIPMEGAPHETAPQEVNQTPQESFFEFNANGRQIKIPQNDPRVKQWLEMGYSAPNKLGQLNQELSKYKNQIGEFETKYKPYIDVDTWAKANPDKWQTVLQNYQQAIQTQPGMQNYQVPPELEQKIQGLEEKFQTIEQKEELQRQEKADTSLDTEVESIRKSYPNLDFNTPDQFGNSLEAKILDHALKNGLPSFRAAFRDYCYDQLVSMAQEKGKETTAKSISKTRSLGLPGKSPAPSRGPQAPNLKNLNYDQIHEMILQAEGIG